jgi:hypothetical protein
MPIRPGGNVATRVEVVQAYVLRVTFADGFSTRVDVEPVLWGEMFEPLRAPELFAQARVDPGLGTVVWPNGADLSPEFLRAGTPDLASEETQPAGRG